MSILFRILLVTLLFSACSSDRIDKNVFRIGIDPTWYPIDFAAQEQYVNGFVSELLLEISLYTGITFERVEANWDALVDGLQKHRYDAILSALSPYNYNTANFDFSEKFLSIGPVLIVPKSSNIHSLKEMDSGLIGVQTPFTLAQYPNVMMRSYGSIPELLNALANGEVDGVLLDKLVADSYVRDLYSGKLKVVGEPLTNAGLRFILLKGQRSKEMKLIRQSLKAFIKDKKLTALLKKWQIYSQAT